ncbi:MAG: family 16 glycoside hydrolase, partial [Planctomycetota bacterium]
MNLKTRIVFCLMGGVLVFAAFAGILAVCLAEEPQAEKPDGNNKCYVCHPGLKTEDISTIHLNMGVTCDECHGPSIEHMHDEMLMTKPDLLFGRLEVKRMCSNQTCHKAGTGREIYSRQDHRDPAAVEAFLKKWLGRMRPNGRAVTHDSVCTDCHGTHNITKSTGTQSEEEAAEWIPAFNGRDLTGWRTSGGASWAVKTGRIIATAGANGQGGTLWTETMYENYLLAVTFRATWPIHAGIWLRGADSKNGPRIEIFDSKMAFTGSVLV